MGIKGLFMLELPKSKSGKKVDSVGEVIDLKDMKGMTLAIDASGMIYSTILALKYVKGMTDSDGNITSHINTIFFKVLLFKRMGIKQIWVFDSPNSSNLKKMHELQKRAERKKKAKTEKGQFTMTSEHANDVKKLLRYMGISYIQAPDGIEAEHYAAKLTEGPEESRFCDYVLSADSDVLLFGGNMLRIQKINGKTGYKIYERKKVLKALGLNQSQFRKLALTLGTDFAPKVPGIGPKRAIQAVLDDKIKLNKIQKKALKLIKAEVPMKQKDFRLHKFNRTKLINWLVSKGFDEARITKSIDQAFKKK